MRRKAITAAVALAVGAAAVATWQQAVRSRNAVLEVTVRQLAAENAAGKLFDRTVTVRLPHRPDPTDNPLVWHYRDAPAKAKSDRNHHDRDHRHEHHLPPDLEIRLERPHTFDGHPPFVVTGTSAAFVRDDRRRPNGTAGYPVLKHVAVQ